jgi:hypothetical protein
MVKYGHFHAFLIDLQNSLKLWHFVGFNALWFASQAYPIYYWQFEEILNFCMNIKAAYTCILFYFFFFFFFGSCGLENNTTINIKHFTQTHFLCNEIGPWSLDKNVLICLCSLSLCHSAVEDEVPCIRDIFLL